MSKSKKNEFQFTDEEIARVMELNFEYLRVRAKGEKVKWTLEIDFFIEGFKKGCRDFFGLNLNEFGFPIYDLQEPRKGFLNSYIYWYLFISEEK